MSRSVAWHPRAVSDLERLHWRSAALVDEAVERFAERGEGTLTRRDDRRSARTAPVSGSVLCVDSVTPETVLVWRVLRYA